MHRTLPQHIDCSSKGNRTQCPSWHGNYNTITSWMQPAKLETCHLRINLRTHIVIPQTNHTKTKHVERNDIEAFMEIVQTRFINKNAYTRFPLIAEFFLPFSTDMHMCIYIPPQYIYICMRVARVPRIIHFMFWKFNGKAYERHL